MKVIIYTMIILNSFKIASFNYDNLKLKLFPLIKVGYNKMK